MIAVLAIALVAAAVGLGTGYALGKRRRHPPVCTLFSAPPADHWDHGSNAALMLGRVLDRKQRGSA